MSWLSDEDLRLMRADVAHMLPDTCVIQAPTRVSNGAGKFTETWSSPAGGTVPCRVGALRGRIQQPAAAGGQEALFNMFMLTVPREAGQLSTGGTYNPSLLRVDRRILHGGYTYEVRGLIDDQSQAVCRQAYILRID